MKTALLVTLVVTAAVAAQADVISLNFYEFAGNRVTNSFGVADVGGWINLRTTSGTDLTTDTGFTSTVDFTATQPNGQASFNGAYIGTAMHAGYDTYVSSAPVVVELSDLVASRQGSSVDVIVYLTGFNSNAGASISDGTTTYFYRNPNPADPTLVQTLDTNSGDGYDVATYARFDGVTEDSITLTLTDLVPGGSGFGGVQVLGVIPEPGTLGLVSLAGAALLAFRRRRAAV
jgi:hypothetical protein